MKKRTCALFVFEGYADWEPALAIASLNKYSDVAILSFSLDGQSVRSMGGLEVKPQRSLADLDLTTIDLLLLPGGEAWENGGNTEILPIIKEVAAQGKWVAAICGATIGLGKAGLLDNRPHTSNGLTYLKEHYPEYTSEALYQNQPSVSADRVITANGAAMIEFAHEIFKATEILDEQTLDAVQELYKSGGMVNKLFA